jgi:preprotein translocase subunit SecF
MSVFAMVRFGFNFGIDFKGGSILEVSYPKMEDGKSLRPDIYSVKETLSTLSLGNTLVSPMGEYGFSIKMKEISQDEKKTLLETLANSSNLAIKEERFNSIGPSVGSELRNKAYTAIAVVILCIVLFIMFAFRKVRKSFNYGLATVIALAHDVIIPTGVYILWIHFRGGEIDLLFVTALLAILGYSVHDTIVVFDRVRENMVLNNSLKKENSFEEVVGKSVKETFGRSINTSLTIFLALVALYFVGGETTKNFAFVLLVGVVAGTYSSIFIASPLLVTLENWRNKK